MAHLPGRLAKMDGSFGEALKLMNAGRKVRRRGWNGVGMWIAIQKPDAHSMMTLPYIYMSTVNGGLVPWLASQTDMLSMDWELGEGVHE